MTFGQQLRAYRLARRLPGAVLAHLAAIDASFLSRVERDEREPPRRDTVLALCHGMRLGGPDTDRLLLLAGYAPVTAERVAEGDPSLLSVARVLDALGGGDTTAFRAAIDLVCRGAMQGEGQ